MENIETDEIKLLNPMTGRFFAWTKPTELVFSSPYHIGVERLHNIVRDLLLKKSYKRGSTKASSSPNTLIRLFKQYDRDGNGSLDRQEFLQMLSDLGLQAITKRDFKELFDKYDLDGDGTISYSEWASAYCNHFTNEMGLLDLPSTRLDIKHLRLNTNEVLNILRQDIISKTKKNNISLRDMVGWSYFGTKNIDILTTKEVKLTLRGQFNIGIGNEAALNLLLDKCTCYGNMFNIEVFEKYIKYGFSQIFDKSTKKKI